MKKLYLNSVTVLFTLGIMAISHNATADYSRSYEGYKVFNTYCIICHGANGKGEGPLAKKLDTQPANLTSDGRLSKKSDQDIYQIIEGTVRHGRSNMPKWRVAISPSQIKGLVSYIRYLHRGKHKLIGNPEKGKAVYDRSCTVCHGNEGSGDGILTKVYSLEPANHVNAKRMDKISNDAMVELVTNGGAGASMMPGWKGILSKQEIIDVVSYIRLLSAH